jgi:tetratricopeptide (TPR) repeat protein
MKTRLTRGVLIVLLLALVIPSAYFGLRAAWSDAITLKARSDIDLWQRENKRPNIEEWRDARDALQRGLRFTPDDPKLYEHLAYLYGLRAMQASRMPELQKPLLEQVSIYYLEALRLRPMSPHTWANIALAGHLLGDRDKVVWMAFDRAMEYGANEPQVQLTLAEIGLSRWGSLDETHRSMIMASFKRAAPALRKQLDKLADQHQVVVVPAPAPAPAR